MKDKEKQIEEMAKDKQWQKRDKYCLRIQKAMQYKGICDHEDIPSILVDYEEEIKKELIPEDSVVLSKEELKRLEKNYKIGLGKSQSWCKSLKNRIEELEKENFKLKVDADEIEKEASKETAEKILNDIYRYNGSLFGTCFYKGHYVSDVRALVKDIAEDYSVEIKG